MSDFDYEAELEAILSEFGAGSSADEKRSETARIEEPSATEKKKEYRAAERPADLPEKEEIYRPVREEKKPETTPADTEDISQSYTRKFNRDELEEQTRPFRRYSGNIPGKEKAVTGSGSASYSGRNVKTKTDAGDKKPSKKSVQTPEKNSGGPGAGNVNRHTGLSILAFLCSCVLLFLVATGVHFGSSAQSGSSVTKGNMNSVSKLDTASNNMKADIMSGLAVIRKIYTIPEGERVAPKPDQACYGVTSIDNLQPVFDTIEKAKSYGLLDGQDVIFSKDVEFYHDPGISSDIQFYCDETIMVICWKELIENRICSCVEVKIADASQFRRKLCEDTYDSSVYLFASDLAKQTNAVVAMNSDYYAFRNLGITVYDRTLYRFNEFTYSGFTQAYNSIDTLLIDSNGDFIFFKTGQQSTREEMEQYIRDNDILFSIAFGPVLVENGEAQVCSGYPCGEINDEYSRAGFAQYDKLHYLYMAVSHADAADSAHPRCTVNQFATYMQSKHVDKAYCFDGGQTGEVVFNGSPYNHIDYGNERTVSDIIYFATALPEEVRG